MAMVSLCLSSFLVRYGGRQIWLKQVWEIGSLGREEGREGGGIHIRPNFAQGGGVLPDIFIFIIVFFTPSKWVLTKTVVQSIQ